MRVQTIRHARTHSVGKSQSCMFYRHIQKMFRGYITRKWHNMMGAMMMLPWQGGIDAAVEKYGFRVIGLLQELQRRERKLGLAHPDTADVLYNLGRLYQQHGDFKEALAAFNKALGTYTKVLGTGHSKSVRFCMATSLPRHSFLES